MRHPTAAIRCALIASFALGALAAGGPALAGDTVEELTVIGHAPKEDKNTKSYVVGFADLNLRTPEGRKELHRRIAVSAAYVCKQIGEDSQSSITACRAQAVSDAMVQARAVEHQVRAHGVHLVPGRPWTPPA